MHTYTKGENRNLQLEVRIALKRLHPNPIKLQGIL